MDKTKNGNDFTMTENGWVTGYGVGDLVKVKNKLLGFVAKKTALDQELMFPFVPVFVFSKNEIVEFQTNSLEIISKA
jgi:hypothetical protein